MSDCQHLQLKKCKVGSTTFYQCVACPQNFTIKPLEIKVSYGREAKETADGK